MEEADHLCDRVAIMDRGRVLALDTPERLKASVDADTVVEVTTDGDPVALAEALGRMPDVVRAEPGEGWARVFFRGSQGVVPRVVADAEAGGFHVTDLSVSEPTLETVFITLTGKDLRE